MTAQMPQHMVGRNLTVCALAAIAADNAGNATVGITSGTNQFDVKALGLFDSVEFEGTLELVDTHSGDALVANYQPKYDDWAITLTAIDNADGSNPVVTMFMGFLYVRVAFQAQAPAYGTGAAGTSGPGLVAIGIRSTVRHGVVEDKNVSQIVLKPCGISVYYGTGTPPF